MGEIVLAIVWVLLPIIPLAIMPFAVYSTFHSLNYVRTVLLPVFLNLPINTRLGRSIGNFIKEYYDTAMMLVSYIEVALWFNVLVPVLRLQKGSWMPLIVYSAFLRARFDQSVFMQSANERITASLDGIFIRTRASIPQWMHRTYIALKDIIAEIVEITDLKTYTTVVPSADFQEGDSSTPGSSQDVGVEAQSPDSDVDFD